MPQHLSIYVDNVETKEKQILAYIPMYLKGHSQGEFIFDQSWAEFAYKSGIKYYPKLLIGIPFTPVTGTRILLNSTKVKQIYKTDDTTCHESEIFYVLSSFRRMVGKFLKQVADSNRFSSVHLNFMTNEEATSFAGPLNTLPSMNHDKNGIMAGMIEKLFGDRHKQQNDEESSSKNNKSNNNNKILPKPDFLRRTSIQYHWVNKHPEDGLPYESFDEYLDTFKSKRRINIKRERRKIHTDEGIRVDAIVGKDILKYEGLVERMFEIYVSTVNKMYWGNQYLTLEFFQKLCYESDFIDNLCFMCARYKGEKTSTWNNDDDNNNNIQDDLDSFKASDVFAGTFNVVKDGVFYGRYWGCLEEVKYLHFEVCYWSAIEYCINNRFKRMEPGAGGGDYKWARGFDATLIHSAHYISNPMLRRAIQDFLVYEIEEDIETTEYLKAKRLGQSEQSFFT